MLLILAIVIAAFFFSLVLGDSNKTPSTQSYVPEPAPSYVGPHRRGMVGERQTLSIMKACELVGCSRRSIYHWISTGKVEYMRTPGGSIRIYADTLWRDA